jgi:hypothetical protein
MAFDLGGLMNEVRCHVDVCSVTAEWQQRYTTFFCASDNSDFIKAI